MSERDQTSAEARFFVLIRARGERELRDLHPLGLDVVPSTAALVEGGWASIDAVVTLKQIEQLVRAGYHVLVEDPVEARIPPDEEVTLRESKASLERE